MESMDHRAKKNGNDAKKNRPVKGINRGTREKPRESKENRAKNHHEKKSNKNRFRYQNSETKKQNAMATHF